jgi:hypothetical protein
MTTVVGTPPFVEKLVGDASIAFSGGLDSTTVAYLIARDGRHRVHLHTLDHGYGYPFNSWAKRTFKTLERAVGSQSVSHRFVKTRDLFDRVAMRSLLADRKKYGQWFGCCLGCSMAVVAKMIIYNLENDVAHILFGSSVGGEYAVMSKAVTVRMQREFCASYGIDYRAPLLEDHIVKADERALLDQARIFRGLRFLDKHSFGNQGYCLLSLQHLPDVLFNVHPEYDSQAVEQFYTDKLPICRAYIEEHFQKLGQPLDLAIARLAKRTGLGIAP